MDSLFLEHKKRKKEIIILIIILVVLYVVIPLSVRISWMHIYHKKQTLKTPYDYPGSTWISTDPEIVLHVSESSEIPADSECYIVYQGERIPVIFLPEYPRLSCIIRKKDSHVYNVFDELLLVDCKFSEREVVMKVRTDNLFGGRYKKIILKAVP